MVFRCTEMDGDGLTGGDFDSYTFKEVGRWWGVEGRK